jgi:hypothetical protein
LPVFILIFHWFYFAQNLHNSNILRYFVLSVRLRVGIIQSLIIHFLITNNMIRYINFQIVGQEKETTDELDSKDYKSLREFYRELNRLVDEYRMAYGCRVWASQRCCKGWND